MTFIEFNGSLIEVQWFLWQKEMGLKLSRHLETWARRSAICGISTESPT